MIKKYHQTFCKPFSSSRWCMSCLCPSSPLWVGTTLPSCSPCCPLRGCPVSAFFTSFRFSPGWGLEPSGALGRTNLGGLSQQGWLPRWGPRALGRRSEEPSAGMGCREVVMSFLWSALPPCLAFAPSPMGEEKSRDMEPRPGIWPPFSPVMSQHHGVSVSWPWSRTGLRVWNYPSGIHWRLF